MSLSLQGVYRFEEFELDPARRALRRAGLPLVLSPKAFDVLSYLVKNPGRVLTKEELLKGVWPGSFVEEGNLAQHISAVRKTLADRSGLIVTVPGRGYQFAAEVQGPPESDRFSQLGAGDVVVQRVRERTHVVLKETLSETQEPDALILAAAAHASENGAKSPSARIAASTLWLGFALAVLLLAGVWGWHRWRVLRTRVSDHHQVVVAKFENRTGDPSFDLALDRAFKIDLEQSPYMDVMDQREVSQTLRLMGKEPEAPLDPAVAREVCIRGNRQVLLTGTVYSLGSTYLVTVEASDCSTGKQIASAQADTTAKARVPAALDSVAGKIRSGLGESAESLERYKVPIAEATTSSLEALTYYSEGIYLDGKRAHSANVLPLYRKATEVDPNFALAYVALAEEYRRLGETDTAAGYFKEAFELRDRVSARERLILEAQYYSAGIGDLPRALEAYHLWAATFPYDSMPKAEPIRLYLELGQYEDAIEAGERAVKANPENVFSYQRLMLAYVNANRFDDAKATLVRAEQVHSDSETMHRFGYEVAVAQHDQLAAEREIERPKPVGAATYGLDFLRGCASAAAGRVNEAHTHFLRADNEVEVEKLSEALANFLVTEAEDQFRLGLIPNAHETLQKIRDPDPNSADIVNLRLDLGDTAQAERFIAAHDNDPATLMAYAYLPRLRAALALHRGRSAEAIAALEPARPYEMRDYEVPALRGEAYLRTGQASAAAGEYKKILANPGINPVSVLYPLAHLGLARAYALQKNTAESRKEYEALFAVWKDADAGLPVLQKARIEYAHLAPAPGPSETEPMPTSGTTRPSH
jgi:DNA-binding winged helix-turn-helix (wHTH) protein/tetratricopeptide (TPR) repeat protein